MISKNYSSNNTNNEIMETPVSKPSGYDHWFAMIKEIIKLPFLIIVGVTGNELRYVVPNNYALFMFQTLNISPTTQLRHRNYPVGVYYCFKYAITTIEELKRLFESITIER